MKKLFLYAFFVLFTAVSYGQGDDPNTNIKYLHSASGKKWKVMSKDREDSYQLPATMNDDLFIFYSNGQFKYDNAGTPTQGFTSVQTKLWTYNRANRVITWEFYTPSGTRRMDAELTYIDDGKAVLNVSEDGKDPNIIVFLAE